MSKDSLYSPVHSVRHKRPSSRCNSHDWARTADRQSKHGASWKLRHTHAVDGRERRSDCIRYENVL